VTRTIAGSGECDGNGMGDGSGAMRAFEASSRVRWVELAKESSQANWVSVCDECQA